LKVLLLVNSSASSVTPRTRVVIRKALSADHEVEVAETNRRDHATSLARGAAHEGVDVVVVLGGDGTLNEAANGLAGSETALAALPGGSTNVFARTIGLPNDPIEATSDLLDALARDAIRPVGLGNVNGRYFLFHTGVGFDAAIVAQVEKRSGMKRYAGHALFIYAGIETTLGHYDRRRPHFSVAYPDGSVVDDGYMTVVLNTNPYTYLGNRPFNLAPDATFDRGLVVVTVRTMKVVPFLAIAASALGSGTRLRKSRNVDYRTDVASCALTAHTDMPYQVDGDHLGSVDRLEFTHEPEALRLVLP
jgi:diacylglycerol kinase family enzyme